MITVEITNEMIRNAKEYAIKKQPTSFPRLDETKEEQHQRLFIGKLTELIGQEGMKKINLPHSCPDKLKVVNRMEYRDVADCIIYPNTVKKMSVDFKSAWRKFHSRILIPEDQYTNQRKDICIGIQLHLVDVEPIPTFPNFEENADVHGWIKWEELHDPDESSSRKYPAYWVYLTELHQLDELLKI